MRMEPCPRCPRTQCPQCRVGPRRTARGSAAGCGKRRPMWTRPARPTFSKIKCEQRLVEKDKFGGQSAKHSRSSKSVSPCEKRSRERKWMIVTNQSSVHCPIGIALQDQPGPMRGHRRGTGLGTLRGVSQGIHLADRLGMRGRSPAS